MILYAYTICTYGFISFTVVLSNCGTHLARNGSWLSRYAYGIKIAAMS